MVVSRIEQVYDRQTKKYFKELGCDLQKVQQFNVFCQRSNDLYGWQDYQGPLNGYIVGVQSTSNGQRKPHLKKYSENAETLANIKWWVDSGGKAILICWEQIPVGKTFRYESTVEDLAFLLGLNKTNYDLGKICKNGSSTHKASNPKK